MSKAKKGEGEKVIATNKNARREFQILDTIEAGIVLQGTEAKAIRQGMSQMTDAHVYIRKGEAYLANLNIPAYEFGNRENHEPLRVRKLLLHKREINRLRASMEEKGRAVVATRMYYKKGRVKVEVAVAQGKKLHDKRQDLKDRDQKKEMQRAIKVRQR